MYIFVKCFENKTISETFHLESQAKVFFLLEVFFAFLGLLVTLKNERFITKALNLVFFIILVLKFNFVVVNDFIIDILNKIPQKEKQIRKMFLTNLFLLDLKQLLLFQKEENKNVNDEDIKQITDLQNLLLDGDDKLDNFQKKIKNFSTSSNLIDININKLNDFFSRDLDLIFLTHINHFLFNSPSENQKIFRDVVNFDSLYSFIFFILFEFNTHIASKISLKTKTIDNITIDYYYKNNLLYHLVIKEPDNQLKIYFFKNFMIMNNNNSQQYHGFIQNKALSFFLGANTNFFTAISCSNIIQLNYCFVSDHLIQFPDLLIKIENNGLIIINENEKIFLDEFQEFNML